MRAMDTEASLHGHTLYKTSRCEERVPSNGERMGTAKRSLRKDVVAGPRCAPPPSSDATFSRRRSHGPSISGLLWLLIVCVLLLARGSHAAFISTFTDCLSPNTINSNPKQLQFTPLWVWAFFDSSSASHNLNVTIYGNVSGQTTEQNLPKPDDSQWKNPNDTLGKLVDVSKVTNLATTLQAQFNVLDYTPYNAPLTRFCNTTVRRPCPIAPVFPISAPNA